MMYDTLMQMGRWFGYRPGYEDLCRVWIPADGVGWYAHIHEAMDDLQTQLKRMELAKATPEQFGLAVRSHPESLIVTARNKMGSGKLLPIKVGLAESLIETTRIVAEPTQTARNLQAGRALLQGLRDEGFTFELRSRGYLARHVPVDRIDTFVRDYRADPANPPADPLTDPRLIRDYIAARADDELKEWDIFIASSTRKEWAPTELGGLDLVPYERSVDPNDYARGVLTISGESRRVGSAEDEREGLSDEQIAAALQAFRIARPDAKPTSTVNPRYYRTVKGRRPLLILRVVRPKITEAEGASQYAPDVLAWGLSFPGSNVAGGKVEYVVNTVRMREIFGVEEIEEEPLGDTE
jgi:hypothetical protein